MTVLSMSRAEIDRVHCAEGFAGRADTTERNGAILASEADNQPIITPFNQLYRSDLVWKVGAVMK